MRMIAAVGRNFEIGRGNDLPWKCPADLRLFKELTHGFTVIMGRKTAESLGQALPGRRNVMLTRSPEVETPQGIQIATLERCLREFPNAWVIGGGAVYEAMLPYVSEIWLSHINVAVPDADAFFPFEAMRQFGFEGIDTVNEYAGDDKSPSFKQIVYRNLK
ncbi:TPA: dihydrofolate reductase [Klebsiella aerogenes]